MNTKPPTNPNRAQSEMPPQKTLEEGTVPPVPGRVYSNRGNAPLLDLLGKGCNRVLDIGCGAGDNAKLLKAMHPEIDISGITHSAAEIYIGGGF